MVSLVRGGPKILIIASDNLDNLHRYLIEGFNAEECELNFAIEKTDEENMILFLTDKMENIVKEDQIKHIMFVKQQPDTFLCEILNNKKSNLISDARLAPRIIVVRGIGDNEKILKEIIKDHNGEVGQLRDVLDKHNNEGNIIVISNKQLNHNVCLSDLYGKVLFVEEKYYSLLRNLRNQALRYVNAGLDNKEWYELQYKRLIEIIENLELGIVIGESWGKDHPRFLMSIEIYRIRIFTMYEPKYIKKVLLGLEYTQEGIRTVDYDMYYNRRKIDWTDLQNNEIKSRKLLGLKYRKKLFKQFSDEEKEKILKIEQNILMTRK